MDASLVNAFPTIPHESAGVDCCGCIVPVVQGRDVELRCNECGAVVGVVQVEILKDLVGMIPDVGHCRPGMPSQQPAQGNWQEYKP